MKNSIPLSFPSRGLRSGGNGFSLVEVLVALVIMGFLVLAVAQLFMSSIYINKFTREQSKMSFFAQMQADNLMRIKSGDIDKNVAPEVTVNLGQGLAPDPASYSGFADMINNSHAGLYMTVNGEYQFIIGQEAHDAIGAESNAIEAWVYWTVETVPQMQGDVDNPIRSFTVFVMTNFTAGSGQIKSISKAVAARNFYM